MICQRDESLTATSQNAANSELLQLNDEKRPPVEDEAAATGQTRPGTEVAGREKRKSNLKTNYNNVGPRGAFVYSKILFGDLVGVTVYTQSDGGNEVERNHFDREHHKS